MVAKNTIILFVDESKNLRAALKVFFDKLLFGQNYTLIHATAVEEALEILEQNQVDLMITELRFRDRSGISLVVQAKRVSAKTPIVVFSSHTDLVTQKDLELLGASYFFEKPTELEKFQRTIAQILQINDNDWLIDDTEN